MKPASASADTAAVLASTRALLEWTRGQGGHCYADDAFSPVSELDVEIIARRFGSCLRTAPLPEGVQELALPAYAGPPIITINRDLAKPFRRLAMRHGLAHLVAGELESEPDGAIRFMSSIHDWMALEERRADLFALADLIPDRDIQQLVRAEPDPTRGRRWMEQQIWTFAPDWPADRRTDRARLRWDLFFTAETAA